MMKRHFFTSLILAVSLASMAYGLDDNLGEFELSAGYWMASGDLSWDKSFDFYNEYLGCYGEGRSRLEWDTDSNYITLEASYSKNRWFGRFQYATGDIDSGTSWDSDWLIYPDWVFYPYSNFTNEPWLRSFNPADGENDFYIFDVGYVLKSTSDGSASIFLGYQEKNLNLHNHDPLIYDIVDWQPAYEVYNLGLASTYDIEFTGFRVGFEGELTLGEKVAVKGLFAFYPDIDAEGVGYWNLRDLHFIQTGDGDGIELIASILYNFNDTWSGEFGYRLQQFEQSGGIDRMYFSDGTTAETEWEKAESKQDGIFLAIRCVF